MQRDSCQVGVVFIHGVLSSAKKAWSVIQGLMEDDLGLARYDAVPFEYSSPVVQWRPDRAIPDLDVIAGSLGTFLTYQLADYRFIALIGHSQGGLVIQRYLHYMLSEGRGEELARIRLVVLFACPNDGSQFMAPLRTVAGYFIRHPQERALRPLNQGIIEARRTVVNRIINATQVGSDTCPIPFFAYAGQADAVVTRWSAQSVFPRVGVLPGDHSTIIKPTSADDIRYVALRNHLLHDLITRADDPPAIGDERLRAYGQTDKTVYHVPRPAQSDRIRAALTEGGITVLHGPGGIGKSVLALDACEDSVVTERFPDVLWATLGQDGRVSAELARWLRLLGGGTDTTVPDLDFLKAEVRFRLRDRRCLLVVDDAWWVSDVRAFNVGGPRCHLLVTTRIAGIAHELGVEPLTIPFLDTGEAVTLLRRWARGRLDETADQRLMPVVSRVSCLPLAVKLAGARLADASVREWLARFDVRRLRAVRVEGVHDSLVATIDLSLDMLEPAQRAACEALAVFPEDIPVTVDIIDQCWRSLQLPVATQDLLADLYYQALTQQVTDSAGVVRHALHDLVRDVLVYHLGPEGVRRVHRSLLNSYQAGESGWPSVADDGYIYDNVVYHLETAGDHESAVRLFTDQRWMNARLDHDPYGYDGYLADLARVRDISEKAEDPGPDLAGLHRYTLIESSLVTLSTAYSPATVVRALELKVWTPEYAVSVARRAVKAGRHEPLLGLLSTGLLSPVHVHEAERLLIDAAHKIPNVEWAIKNVLGKLLGLASPHVAEAITEELRMIAVNDQRNDATRHQAIMAIASHRPWAECGAQLLTAARALSDPALRVEAERFMAAMKGAPADLAGSIAADAVHADQPTSVTDVIAALSSPHDHGSDEYFEHEEVVRSLEALAGELSEDEVQEVMEAALRENGIAEPEPVLRAISSRLSPEQNEIATQWLMGRQHGWNSLLTLAHLQPPARLKALLGIDGSLANSLVMEISTAFEPLTSEDPDFASFTLHFKLDQLHLLLKILHDEAESAAVIDEARQLLLSQEYLPLDPYGNLSAESTDNWIPFLGAAELRTFLRKPHHIGETFWSQDAQATLAQRASASIRSATVERLVPLVPGSAAFQLAPPVCRWLSTEDRIALIDRCLDRWMNMSTHDTRSSLQPRSDSLRHLAGLLTDAQMTRVINEIQAIPDGIQTFGFHQPRATAIINLGHHELTTENARLLAEVASMLSNAEDRREAFAAIVPALPADAIRELWKYADAPSSASSATLLSALMSCLPQDERSSHDAAVRAHADETSKLEGWLAGASMETLITSCSPTVLPYLLDAVRRFPKSAYVVGPLTAAASRLPQAQRDLLVREAYEIADALPGERSQKRDHFVSAIRKLASLLPENLAQSAWQRLLTPDADHEDDQYRLQQLLLLLKYNPQLDPSHREARQQVTRHLSLLARESLSSVLYFDGVADWLGPILITPDVADEMIRDIDTIVRWTWR